MKLLSLCILLSTLASVASDLFNYFLRLDNELMWVIMMNIHLLCFIHYNLGYFGRVGNRIVVYSPIIIYSPALLVFAR